MRIDIDGQVKAVEVRSPDEAAGLPFGTPYVVVFDDEPEPPIEYDEAFHPLDVAVSEAIAEVFKGNQGNQGQGQGNQGQGQGQGNSASRTPALAVKFLGEHVELWSPTDQTVQVSGDVRDGTVKLRAGRTARRKLTGEGHGFVSVDGVEYPVT